MTTAPPSPTPLELRLDFMLTVDRLIAEAERARELRDLLLDRHREAGRPDADTGKGAADAR